VHHLPALISQDYEHEQHPECCREDSNEVDGGDLLGVVAEEGCPILRRWAMALGAVTEFSLP